MYSDFRDQYFFYFPTILKFNKSDLYFTPSIFVVYIILIDGLYDIFFLSKLGILEIVNNV